MINEANSVGNGADYIELFNKGTGTVDISGWTVTDNAPTTSGHTYTFATPTMLAAGGYVALHNPADFGFGLGDADSVILNNNNGVQIDRFDWTMPNTMGSYSRCPNGTGSFVDRPLTNNGANNCP